MKKLTFLTLALACLLAPAAQAQLLVGNGTFAGGTANDNFEIDIPTDTAASIGALSIGGATYDATNDQWLATISGGASGVDYADLVSIPIGGGAATNEGIITNAAGAGLRIDGLGFSGGVLYGVHQFDDAAGTAGIYEIDQGTFVATMVVALASGAISGIDGDPDSGLIYGVDDTAGQIVEIDVGAGTANPIAAYPAGRTDIDGIGACNGGLLYLVEDENAPIAIYDLGAAAYAGSLTGPLAAATTFSAGACVSSAPMGPPDTLGIPTMSTVGFALLALLLAGAAMLMMRRRTA